MRAPANRSHGRPSSCLRKSSSSALVSWAADGGPGHSWSDRRRAAGPPVHRAWPPCFASLAVQRRLIPLHGCWHPTAHRCLRRGVPSRRFSRDGAKSLCAAGCGWEHPLLSPRSQRLFDSRATTLRSQGIPPARQRTVGAAAPGAQECNSSAAKRRIRRRNPTSDGRSKDSLMRRTGSLAAASFSMVCCAADQDRLAVCARALTMLLLASISDPRHRFRRR